MTDIEAEMATAKRVVRMAAEYLRDHPDSSACPTMELVIQECRSRHSALVRQRREKGTTG